jgi:hypothetical protein
LLAPRDKNAATGSPIAEIASALTLQNFFGAWAGLLPADLLKDSAIPT